MQTRAIKIRAWDDATMTWTCDDWNDKPYMRAIAVHSAVAFAEPEFRGARGEVCCHASGTFRILRKRTKSLHAHRPTEGHRWMYM